MYIVTTTSARERKVRRDKLELCSISRASPASAFSAVNIHRIQNSFASFAVNIQPSKSLSNRGSPRSSSNTNHRSSSRARISGPFILLLIGNECVFGLLA